MEREQGRSGTGAARRGFGAGGGRGSQREARGIMKAYYLVLAVAASVAAIAVASQLQNGAVTKEREAKAEAEMEAWFI